MCKRSGSITPASHQQIPCMFRANLSLPCVVCPSVHSRYHVNRVILLQLFKYGACVYFTCHLIWVRCVYMYVRTYMCTMIILLCKLYMCHKVGFCFLIPDPRLLLSRRMHLSHLLNCCRTSPLLSAPTRLREIWQTMWIFFPRRCWLLYGAQFQVSGCCSVSCLKTARLSLKGAEDGPVIHPRMCVIGSQRVCDGPVRYPVCKPC